MAVMIFNPRLREGGDNVSESSTYIPFVFNPRLREGGDIYTLAEHCL